MTYSFSYLEPVCCSMCSSNCCFLTCIRVSQEAGQVFWDSHLFQNFPQFIVIHTVINTNCTSWKLSNVLPSPALKLVPTWTCIYILSYPSVFYSSPETMKVLLVAGHFSPPFILDTPFPDSKMTFLCYSLCFSYPQCCFSTGLFLQ